MNQTQLEYTIEEQETIIDKLVIENNELKGLMSRICSDTGYVYSFKLSVDHLLEWSFPDPYNVTLQMFIDMASRATSFTDLLGIYTVCLFNRPLIIVEDTLVYIKMQGATQHPSTRFFDDLLTFIMEEIRKHASVYCGENLLISDIPSNDILKRVVIDSILKSNLEYTHKIRSRDSEIINSLLTKANCQEDPPPTVIREHILDTPFFTLYSIPVVKRSNQSNFLIDSFVKMSGARCF